VRAVSKYINMIGLVNFAKAAQSTELREAGNL
jgi:hypothetical protein